MRHCYEDISECFTGVKPIEPKSWRRHGVEPHFEKALDSASEAATKEPLRVLCLASGDVRNVLHSLAGLDNKQVGGRRRKFDVVVNDYDIHVIARNILLLDCIFDETCSAETIFAIWFSTGLGRAQHDFLRSRLRQLITGCTDSRGMASLPTTSSAWYWRCYEADSLAKVTGIWEKWLGFFDATTDAEAQKYWDATQTLRHETFLGELRHLSAPQGKTQGAAVSDAEGRSTTKTEALRKYFDEFVVPWQTMLLKLNCDVNVFPESLMTELHAELTEHMVTGVFDPTGNVACASDTRWWYVNPTLFWDEENYDLHYGSNSVAAFPTFTPKKDVTLAQRCLQEFQSWVAAARAHRESVSWTFSCADACAFCMNFDPDVLGWTSVDVLAAERVVDRGGIEVATLRPGALVQACGLKGSAHLNGCFGALTHQVPDSGRWGVQFLGAGGGDTPTSDLPSEPVSLKPANLKVAITNGGLLHRSPGHKYFDVVTTSNVADHIGMSTLLLVSRPLLKAGGVLLTTNFLAISQAGSVRKYRQANLLGVQDVEVPTVFGFRALGYEPDTVTTDACRVAHNLIDPFQISTPQRCNLVMVWIATTTECNVPLDGSSDVVRRLLFFNVRDDVCALGSIFQNMEGKVSALLKRCGVDDVCLGAGERGWLSQLLEAVSSEDAMRAVTEKVALCGVIVSDDEMRDLNQNGLVRTPMLCVNVAGEKIFGLWMGGGDTEINGSRTCQFLFFCSRKLVETHRTCRICNITVDPFREIASLETVLSEQTLDTQQLQRICSFLVGRPVCVPKSAAHVDDDIVELSSAVTCKLLGENDKKFEVRISLDASIFGALSRTSVVVRQVSAHSVHVEMAVGPISRRCLVEQTFVFAGPVIASGWKYDAASGVLALQKSVHNFFSSVRRSIGTNRFCQYENCSGFSGWNDTSLSFFSAYQMTPRERLYKTMKVAPGNQSSLPLPLLFEVKDSIITFLQLPDVLWQVVIKEPGVGSVATIVRHGVLVDRQTCSPVLDLSVSCLNTELGQLMGQFSMQYLTNVGAMQTILMHQEEYTLFQNLFNHRRACLDPALCKEHPDLRKIFKNKKTRANFRRVLLSPFYPSAVAHEESVVLAKAMGSVRS